MYQSQVSFTLDTICPWTFIAKKRLDQALAQFRSSPSASSVTFTLHFEPYQLFPDFPQEEDKQSWYLHNKHLDNPEAQAVFQEHMQALASGVGQKFNFDGPIGNTLQAHRVIQHFQETKGATAANKLVDALYRRYFLEAQHPASDGTLVDSCMEAGISEDEAQRVVAQDRETGEREVRARIREVAMDADAVPIVVVEGKRRDITLTGAKEVKEYVKAFETVAKESS